MKINITLLGKYLADAKCPTQIMLDTDDKESFLRFLRGEDENGSLAIYLSFDDINQILSLNDVESKMINIRDLPSGEFADLGHKRKDKGEVINDILYGTISRYIMQLFAASSGRIIYPELEILPGHKKSYFASVFDRS